MINGRAKSQSSTNELYEATTGVQFFEYFTNENSIKFILDFVLFFMLPFAASNRSAIVFVETEDALSIAHAMRMVTANKKNNANGVWNFRQTKSKKKKKEKQKRVIHDKNLYSKHVPVKSGAMSDWRSKNKCLACEIARTPLYNKCIRN